MKKIVLFVIVLLCFISCREKGMEFIESKIYPLYLVENIPKNDSIMKDGIKKFLFKEKPLKSLRFYRYTWGTSYFEDNAEHDGGPTSYIFLSNYNKENIANFVVSECEKDSTKLVGELFFYGNLGLENNSPEIDTLIYHCK